MEGGGESYGDAPFGRYTVGRGGGGRGCPPRTWINSRAARTFSPSVGSSRRARPNFFTNSSFFPVFKGHFADFCAQSFSAKKIRFAKRRNFVGNLRFHFPKKFRQKSALDHHFFRQKSALDLLLFRILSAKNPHSLRIQTLSCLHSVRPRSVSYATPTLMFAAHKQLPR